MIRYSHFHHVNEAVTFAIYGLDPAPYADSRTAPRVKIARKSIADIIDEIRVRFGDCAAASVKITVH
jgi:hypothetical protein